MHPLKDTVALGILAGSFPPSFDDVAVALKVAVWAVEDDESPGEKLKGDSFDPANVTALNFNERPTCSHDVPSKLVSADALAAAAA